MTHRTRRGTVRRALVVLAGIALLLTLLAMGARPAHAAPGDLDATFSGDGKLTTSFGSGNDEAQGVAVQQNGKIVVAGYAHNVNGNGTIDFALTRYNPNGTLDATFDGDGKVTAPIGSGDDYAYAVAVQQDGKIVVAGATSGNFALVRYNSNGTPDTSFGVGGELITDFGSDDGARDVAVQQDGKIVAVGWAGGDFALARYLPDGSRDTSFDGDGKLTTDFGHNDYADAVAVQQDGKIVAAGAVDWYSGGDFALARYHRDGSLDTSFDGDGKLTTDFGAYDRAEALAIKGDGSIFAAGSSENQVEPDFALARYDENGNPVGSFGVGGQVKTNFEGEEFSAEEAYAIRIQQDGRIMAAGYSLNGSGDEGRDFALARYKLTGALDTTFSNDGKLTTDFGSATDTARALAIQKDGKLVAVGTASNGSNQNFALVRYYGGSDTTTPTITGTTPAHLAKNVPPTANVTATFSDAMDPATVSPRTFKLIRKGTTKAVGATVKYAPAKKRATLDPKLELRAGATYKALVVGGAKGVKDLSGNALASNETWSFTVRQ